MGALVLTAYCAVAFWVWTRTYRALVRQHRDMFPSLEWDDGDRAFGILWGGGVALAWPISVPIFCIWLSARWLGRSTSVIRVLFAPLERLERED